MRGMSLGDRVLWRRVRDFVHRYQPFLIGVVGVSQVELTRQAIATAIGGDRTVAVPQQLRSGYLSVAKGVLGISETKTLSWWQILGQSLITETLQEEPNTIILSLYPHRPGQIDWLAQALPWQMMVVTDVNSVHLDYFHDQANVIHEITSAIAGLSEAGLALINTSDEQVADIAQHSAAQRFTYGTASDADVHSRRFERRLRGGFVGEITVHGKSQEIHLPQLVGRWQLQPIAAGLQAAHVLGSDVVTAARRLQTLTLPPRHLVFRRGKKQAGVLDHTAAVAPEVVLADLETLPLIAAGRRSIVVLHELPGLAGMSERWHRKLGAMAGQTASVVIGIGQQAKVALIEAALAGTDVHHFATSEDVAIWLPNMLKSEDTVLLTGGGQRLSAVV